MTDYQHRLDEPDVYADEEPEDDSELSRLSPLARYHLNEARAKLADARQDRP